MRNVLIIINNLVIAYVLILNFKHDTPVGRAPRWPEKRVIDFTMEGFNALLYTPNVRGIVWLLAQHQDQLGKKIIRSFTVHWHKMMCLNCCS